MSHVNISPKKVLITRLSAIGDCILTIPLAISVKQLWPNCEITWVVQCAAASLLQEHPAVDRVIKIEKQWIKRISEWRRLRREFRKVKFDLVLDPQGLTKSALLGWLSGARHRVGFDRSHARELAPWLATQLVTRRARHSADVYREILSPWENIVAGSAQFHMPVYQAAATVAERLIGQLQLGREWMCINVGAGWPSKVWPADRFALLARTIREQWGTRSLIVWAGEAERRMAQQVVDSSNYAALAPATSLPELAELLRRSALYVGGDTGPMHLATAVGTRCVALMGPTWADECGPYGCGHIAIQSPVLPQRKSSIRHNDDSAMRAITVDEVIKACSSILRPAANCPSAA